MISATTKYNNRRRFLSHNTAFFNKERWLKIYFENIFDTWSSLILWINGINRITFTFFKKRAYFVRSSLVRCFWKGLFRKVTFDQDLFHRLSQELNSCAKFLTFQDLSNLILWLDKLNPCKGFSVSTFENSDITRNLNAVKELDGIWRFFHVVDCAYASKGCTQCLALKN